MPIETAIPRRLNEAGLKAPRAVTVAVTNRCNLVCRHCWLNSGPDEQSSIVPKNQVLRVIEDCLMLGAEKITITGGEPLTHPDWFEILHVASSNPGVKEIRLQTNAILITPSNLDKMLCLQGRGVIIQTSLEGATSPVHDRVRGKGAFGQTMRGMELLVKHGIPRQVCITFTEMQHNFEDIPDLLELADNMGIGRFVTGTLVCGGRAAQSGDLLPPTPAQYKRLLRRYRDDKVFQDRYRRLGNIAALEWATAKGDVVDTCCTFIETPFIDAKGRFYPCVMLHADNVIATEIFKRPLAAAISEMIEIWSQLQQINRSRLFQLKTCRGCRYYRICGSGCMGRAYSAHGVFFAAEDRCNLRKAVYSFGDWFGKI